MYHHTNDLNIHSEEKEISKAVNLIPLLKLHTQHVYLRTNKKQTRKVLFRQKAFPIKFTLFINVKITNQTLVIIYRHVSFGQIKTVVILSNTTSE